MAGLFDNFTDEDRGLLGLMIGAYSATARAERILARQLIAASRSLLQGMELA